MAGKPINPATTKDSCHTLPPLPPVKRQVWSFTWRINWSEIATGGCGVMPLAGGSRLVRDHSRLSAAAPPVSGGVIHLRGVFLSLHAKPRPSAAAAAAAIAPPCQASRPPLDLLAASVASTLASGDGDGDGDGGGDSDGDGDGAAPSPAAGAHESLAWQFRSNPGMALKRSCTCLKTEAGHTTACPWTTIIRGRGSATQRFKRVSKRCAATSPVPTKKKN